MGGRELKEDIQKLQKMTGASYDECLKAFVLNKHDIEASARFLKWSKNYVVFNE